MQNDKRALSKGAHKQIAALVLSTAIAMAPLAHAGDFYLARAIGEPAPAVREPAASAPVRDTPPELPGLGTEPRAQDSTTTTSESSSTWKWVVGITVAAAVVALAKGGGKGGDDPAPSSGGNTGGGSGGGGSGGGGSGGGGGSPLPSLPGLPGGGDDDD